MNRWTLIFVFSQALIDEVLEVGSPSTSIDCAVMQLANSINQLRSSVSRERLVSSCKLVCVAPETPHIYLFAVRKTCVNVRTDPLKICSMLLSIVLSLQKVRQTKVCNLDCTIGTAEYSLTCDFSVNHTFCVHYLHTFGNLVKRVLAELLKISFAAP